MSDDKPRKYDDWRNIHRERFPVRERAFEHADGSYHALPDYNIPPEKFGLILTPPEARRALTLVEPPGLVEPPAVVESTIAGYGSVPESYLIEKQPLVDWYDQVGGTCGGYSGAQGGTETFSHYPDTVMVFSGMDMYRAAREAGGVDPDNINQGIQMPWLMKALTTKGRSRRLDGKWQPRSLQYGADSTYSVSGYLALRKAAWNNLLAYRGEASTPRMSLQIGIPIYTAFLSPKIVNGAYWVYWQTGSWGSLAGGHAMLVTDYSDTIKLTPSSKGSVLLPNTWGYDFPPCRMSIESLMKCMSGWGEMWVVVSKPYGPAGHLELVEPFTISPGAPKTGDTITAHMRVKNTGAGNWSGDLVIEDMVDGVGKAGFGRSPALTLKPGEVYDHNPQRPEPLTSGHWRFRGDQHPTGGAYAVMGTVEVDVSGNPPPPPPPDAETMTADELSFVVDGKTYSSKQDQPQGVVFREKKAA